MKKLGLFLGMALLVSAVCAQDAPEMTEGTKEKNAGNEAYNNKDYPTAIAHYEKYLNSGEEGIADDIYTANLYEMSYYYGANAFVKDKNFDKAYDYYKKFNNFGRSDTPNDGRFWFSFANTANKVNKDDEAMDYYKKCISLKYNEDACYFAVAQIFRSAEAIDSMKQYLVYGIENFPQSRYYGKMLLLFSTQELKEAVAPFNEASTWSKKAAEAGTDINVYLTNMEKAVAKYKEAIPMFEDVLKYPGVDDKTKANEAKAQGNITVCKESIKRYEDYRKTIKK